VDARAGLDRNLWGS